MFFAGLLVAFSFVCCCAANETTTEQEIPFVIAPQGGAEDGKPDRLPPEFQDLPPLTDLQAPDGRGRSDIEIEEERPFGGYFYPKPSNPFNLPPFKALDANAPLVGQTFAEESTEVDRLPRSPQFRRPYYQQPPVFIPGFIPPHHIRPLPALYGRRGVY